MVGSSLKGRETSCIVNGGVNYGPRERVMLEDLYSHEINYSWF
jgi:hypothetical protein